MGLCVLLTLALRAPFLTAPLLSDEAGLLIVAGNWQEGPYLYGDYFVGRGIVVVLWFKLAEALGGALAVRLLACVVAVALVASAGWAGHLWRGRQGAGWSALAAAAYSSMYVLSSTAMNERLLAAALVTLSCALTVAAVRSEPGLRAGRRRYVLGVLAGMVGASAVLVVQSYVEGLAFAGVLLLVSWRVRAVSGADAARVAGAGVAGLLLVLAALAVAVLTTWLTAEQLWFQMFGYRLSAVSVLAEDGDRAIERFAQTGQIFVLTGLVLLVLGLLLGYRRARQRPDLVAAWWAVSAMAVLAVVGMIFGGVWYSDYLLELVPALVLATALVAPERALPGLVTRAGAVLAAMAAVVALVLGVQREFIGPATGDAGLGQWLAEASGDDDTAVILWGEADVLHASGMSTPYPYLWSLLTRTLDQDLELLLSTLRGPEAPTWIVEYYPMESWDLDANGEMAALIDDRYVLVGSPCGYDVFLLRTERRAVPPSDLCGRLG